MNDPLDEIQRKDAKIWRFVVEGVEAYRSSKYLQALEFYDNALGLDSSNAVALRYKGDALEKLGRYDEAIKIHDQILKKRYDNKNYFLDCIQAGIKLGFEGFFGPTQISYNDDFHEIPVGIEYSLYRKTKILEKLGRYKEALNGYDEMIQIKPKQAYLYYIKAKFLEGFQRFKEAVQCYDKMLEIDGKDISALFDKGRVLEEVGSYDEAIECYDKILEIYPDNVAPLEYKQRASKKKAKFKI